MYYTYVLWSEKSQKFYIGYTADLKRRLSDHKNNKGHTTSRMDNPQLIFYEGFISKEDALRREAYFKTAKGKTSLRFIVRDSIKNIAESNASPSSSLVQDIRFSF